MTALAITAIVLGLLAPQSRTAVKPVASHHAPFAATVSGTVFDSIALRPLEGARVQLVAANDPARTRTTTSGPDGSFRFDSVASGEWIVGFYHAVLDEYGIEARLERLRVSDAGDIRTALAIPSARTIVERTCGTLDRESGLYVGFVRTPLGTSPERRAHVQVQWNAFTLAAKGMLRSTPTLEVETSEQGGFSVCGVPAGGVMVARAWAGKDSSGLVELEVPKGGMLRRDLLVAHNRSVGFAANRDERGDSSSGAGPRVSRGSGTLRGRVTHTGGAPLADARVVLWGSGVEVTTDTTGRFSISDLPLGSWTLEARALGFVRIRQPVDITPDGRSEVQLSLDAVTTVLDTVRVLGQRVALPPDMRDFERRRKSGFGVFLDETEIDKRRALFVSDLFRMVPGVSVVPTGTFSHAILMPGRTLGGTVVEDAGGRKKSAAGCVPTFFIDGVRMQSDVGDVELFVSTAEIRAIEVYTRASNVPSEFNTTSGCGSVVIHTGPRGVLPRPR